MRILTGKYKGRVIVMPKGIRPTQDKVRKALFDILGDVEGLSFLELFAGSASVGFEAVSQGACELILVESNRQCQLAIKNNIELLKLEDRCILIPQEAERALERINKSGKKLDIIFLDPPYHKDAAFQLCLELKEEGGESLAKKTLQILGAYDILAPNGLIIVQHFKKDNLPGKLGDLMLFKQSRYGDTVLSFYKKLKG